MAEIVAAALTSHAPLMTGKPEISRPEQRERLYAGFHELQRRMAATRPDVIVMFVNDHLQNFPYSNLPAFCVGLADAYDAPSPGSSRFMRIPPRKIAGARELSMALLEQGLASGFDFAFSYEIDTWDELAVPLHFLTPEGDVPIAPIYTNCAAPPLPTPARCHQMGAFVGVSAWRSSPPVASRTGSARPRPDASIPSGTSASSITSREPTWSRSCD